MRPDTLVYACQQEDDRDQAPLSVEGLYRAHADLVFRWAQRLGGPSVSAEDVVQQVFVIVQRRLESLREVESIRGWLFRVTQNEVRQHRRRESWRRIFRRGDNRTEDTDDEELAAAGWIDRDDPFAALARKQSVARVYRILDRMGEKYRSVLILFQLEGLSGEEIAELTGLKTNAVWVRLHRARAQFLELLADEEAEETP